jgi:cytochrome P450
MSSPSSQVAEVLNRFIYRLYEWAREADARPSGGAIVSDPAVVDAILKAPERFRKNFSLIGMLGDNRFNTNGEEWRRRRDLTQPAYARAGASRNRSAVAAAYQDALHACKAPTPQAVQQALLTASTTIFFNALDCTVAVERLLSFFDRAREVLKHLQYQSWVAPDASAASALRREAKSLLEDYDREVARSPELLALVYGLQRSGQHIPDFVAVEELLMNFFAGIETTAATLSFAIDRLGVDARVQQRLFEEVEADGECPYLDCFINETMRYFPAIPFVVRQPVSDTAIGHTEFKAGQLIMLSVVGVHHHPAYWREPEIFDSSRAEFMQNTYDRRAFIPFLAGPRMCGGATLARLELVEGLKAFIRQFEVRRHGDEIRFDYGLALRPNTWAQIEIARRAG